MLCRQQRKLVLNLSVFRPRADSSYDASSLCFAAGWKEHLMCWFNTIPPKFQSFAPCHSQEEKPQIPLCAHCINFSSHLNYTLQILWCDLSNFISMPLQARIRGFKKKGRMLRKSWISLDLFISGHIRIHTKRVSGKGKRSGRLQIPMLTVVLTAFLATWNLDQSFVIFYWIWCPGKFFRRVAVLLLLSIGSTNLHMFFPLPLRKRAGLSASVSSILHSRLCTKPCKFILLYPATPTLENPATAFHQKTK